MTVVDETLATATTRHPLTGLVPAVFLRTPRHSTRTRLRRTAVFTIPAILIGSLAMSMIVPTPADAAPVRKNVKQKALAPAKAAKPVARKTGTVPSTYKVRDGDTVSSVATQYGLSTASVLTLNGLGWKSLIYPGQVLKLSKAAASSAALASSVSEARSYTIVSGDTVAQIAKKHGVATNAVLVANGLKSSSLIFPGQKLMLPDAGSFSSTDVDTVPIDLVSNITPSATTYELATGDTITSVADKFGVSVSALLTANDLDASSLIYAGRSLTIPKASAYVTGHGYVTVLTSEMRANAKIIVKVGRSLGASDRALTIALATAMQESGLKNISYGDLDSVGLFQQRPSKGWGTVAQILNPEYAARAFFLGVGTDNPGLFDISGWSSMTLTKAAQSVQVSAFPDAYAQWETSAEYWMDELG